MGAKLHIRLLGRFEWDYEDDLHTIHELPRPATAKSQSLLAYLISQRPDQYARARLMSMFWGERPERKARRSLSTALWHIRRCLPHEECIVGDGEMVGFDFPGALWLDVEQFEALAGRTENESLQTAMDLYRGPFMDGFYDDWIVNERYRLESIYVDLLAKLMTAYEMAANHAAALQTAQRLLQMDELREGAHRTIMRACCHLGRRHEAIAQYERCCAALRAELDIDPLAETSELHHAIVTGRFEVAPQSLISREPQPTHMGPGAARNPLDVIADVPLVGRANELTFLAESWQMGLGGGCSLLLIRGEAGVGKTRLMQEFIAPLTWQGIRILQGRCYEFEQLLPYQPLAEALRSLPPAAITAVVTESPAWVVAQAARLAPDLFDVPPELSPRSPSGEEQTRFFEGVSHFIAELAAQEPMLLLFEDLHWATDSTLQLIHYLARQLIHHPLLLVGTLRPEAVSPAHPLATLGRRLERDGLARRLSLPRLSANAVDALIGQLSGDSGDAKPLARRLYAETEGNPFFLIQTVKTLFEAETIRLESGIWQGDFAALSRADLPLPASVGETIQARIGRLNPETQVAIRLAAVVGRKFDFDLLNSAWGKGEEVTLAALDDLLRQRLIREGAGEINADYLFTHHKIQEVVYGGLSQHRRQQLHGQVGLALEQLVDLEIGDRAGELGHHFEQACLLNKALVEKAVIYLRRAGVIASTAYAHQEAIDFYQRALRSLHALPPVEHGKRLRLQITGPLYASLADTYQLIGDVSQARDAFAAALQHTPKRARILQARLHYKVATMISWSEPEETWRVLGAGEAALGDHPFEPEDEWWETWLDVQMRRAMACYWQRKPQEMEVQVKKIGPHVRAHGTAEQQAFFYGLLGNYGFARDRLIPTPETLQFCRTCLSAAQKTGNPQTVADAEFRLGFALLWLDRLDEAEAWLQKSYDYATEAGVVSDQLLCLTYFTYIHRKRQQVKQTADFAAKCLKIAHKIAAPHYVVSAHGALAWVARRAGDMEEAEKNGQMALKIWREQDTSKTPLLWTVVWPLLGVALAAGDIAKAIEYASMMLDSSQQRLPEAMTSALESAIAAWQAEQPSMTQRHIEEATGIATEQGFL